MILLQMLHHLLLSSTFLPSLIPTGVPGMSSVPTGPPAYFVHKHSYLNLVLALLSPLEDDYSVQSRTRDGLLLHLRLLCLSSLRVCTGEVLSIPNRICFHLHEECVHRARRN